MSFINSLLKGFIRSAVNQIGRDGGRVVSNKIYKGKHYIPIQNQQTQYTQRCVLPQDNLVYQVKPPGTSFIFESIGAFVIAFIFPPYGAIVVWFYAFLNWINRNVQAYVKTEQGIILTEIKAQNKQDLRYNKSKAFVLALCTVLPLLFHYSQ